MIYKYMKYLIKLNRIGSKRNNVVIDFHASFSRTTEFGGFNKIFAGADVSNSIIGTGTYIANNSVLRNCRVGAFCSIGPNISVIRGQHPTTKFVSTHPAFFSLLKDTQAGFNFINQQYFPDFKFADEKAGLVVDIGNDVWIGAKAMIMEGVTIGDGVIVAAGSLVTRNLEPYGVYGGIPAKLIKKRFTDDQIDELLKIKWWNNDFDWLKQNALKFHNIESFIAGIVTHDK